MPRREEPEDREKLVRKSVQVSVSEEGYSALDQYIKQLRTRAEPLQFEADILVNKAPLHMRVLYTSPQTNKVDILFITEVNRGNMLLNGIQPQDERTSTTTRRYMIAHVSRVRNMPIRFAQKVVTISTNHFPSDKIQEALKELY